MTLYANHVGYAVSVSQRLESYCPQQIEWCACLSHDATGWGGGAKVKHKVLVSAVQTSVITTVNIVQLR